MSLLKKLRARLLIGLCFFLCANLPALADIYAYRDEQGFTHFTNAPKGDPRYKRVYRIPGTGQYSTSASQPAPSGQLYTYKDENGVSRSSSLPHLGRRYQLKYPAPSSEKSEPPLGPATPLLSATQPVLTTMPASETANGVPGGLVTAPNTTLAVALPTHEANATAVGKSWSWALLIVVPLLFFFWRHRPAATGSARSPPPDSDSSYNGESKTPSSYDSASPSWYGILGVAKDASVDEIRRAFRERMSEYHPDKVASLGAEIRELAERKSKEINLAYRNALRANGIEK